MKKIFSAILAATMLITVFSQISMTAYAEVINDVSNNAIWSLDTETGELSLGGNGYMNSFNTWYMSYKLSNGLSVTTDAPWNYKGQHINDIKKVTFSEGVLNIGKSSFVGCTEIKSVSISNTVETIENDAFFACRSLESLFIPKGVISIGERAFSNCIGIETITADPENPVFHSYGNCLIETETKTLVLGCKSSVIPDDGSVIEIGSRAFDECTTLTSIVIPKSIKYIGSDAFSTCLGLKDVYYCGSQKDWNNVTIYSWGGSNDSLLSANKHFNYIPPCNNHTPSETTIENEVQATCTTDGSYDEVVYCSVCNMELSRETKTIEKYKHSIVIDEAVEATCTTSGLTEGSHCSRCGEIIKAQEFVSQLDHNYIANEISPTCTKNGFTSFTCTHCGNTYNIDETLPLGHNLVWTETTPTKAATCTEVGATAIETGKCSRCDYTETRGGEEILALGHSYTSSVTAATCTAGGYTTYTCTVCGESYKDNETAALGHTVVTDKAVPATYTTEGKTEGKHCSVCGEVLVAQKTIAKLAKKANTLTVKGKTATVKLKSLKKKNQTVAQKNAFTVSKAQGKVTYAKASGEKKITIAKNGAITVKKGLKKGTYKVKVKVTAAGNATYKSATKTVTVTIKVK